MEVDNVILQGEPIYYAHTLNKSFKELIIVPISDLHYGNPLCSTKHFSRTLQLLERSNTYTLLNGDLIEAVIKTSKGDIHTQKGTAQKQVKWVISKLKPYRKKILGMTMGNHEKRIYDSVGHDYCSDMATELGIPYRPEGILLKISFGDNNKSTADKPYVYWIYATHGYGGARTKASKAIKVERTGTWMHADCYIMSHDHVVNVAPDVYLMPDPRTRPEKDEDGNETGFIIGSLSAKRKMLIKSNAYLKWGGYSEMGGFPPVDLVSPIIHLSGKGKPHVSVTV